MIRLSTKLFLILFILFYPFRSVYSISAPQQVTPSNETTTSNSTLTWENSSEAVQYRVVVDDEPSLSSPYIKNYYTSNIKYSPQLEAGKYYWKVAAKDSSGLWSSWSDVWSFTLGTSSSPSSINSSDPSPSASTQSQSSFTISNLPSQLNSDQVLVISVNLNLPNNPTTNFYLKGAFKKPDSSNYFGLTNVGSNWIANGSSYSNQFLITTNSVGNWSGNLEVKVDEEDSGYTGSWDYIFKVGRYTQSGSGPSWSNEVGVKITDTTNDPSSTTSKSIKSSKATASPIVSAQVLASLSKSLINFQKKAGDAKQSYATISGVATQSSFSTTSPQSLVKTNKSDFRWLFISLGTIFLLIGAFSLAKSFKRS